MYKESVEKLGMFSMENRNYDFNFKRCIVAAVENLKDGHVKSSNFAAIIYHRNKIYFMNLLLLVSCFKTLDTKWHIHELNK